MPELVADLSVPTVNILGVGVHVLSLARAVGIFRGWLADGGSRMVTVTGVHGVVGSRRDETLRRILAAADLVTADGMPIVWLSRLRGHPEAERVYGPDLLLAVCEAGLEEGWRHYFYGGDPGVAEELARRLAERFPGLRVAGTYHPPYRPLTAEEDADVCARIAASGAQFVWVGLSTPKQERFMSEHLARFGGVIQLGVGAAFDFHSGRKPQAPRWIQRSGLEWLFRAISEPRRLGMRYLRNNLTFLVLLALEVLGLRRYPLGR